MGKVRKDKKSLSAKISFTSSSGESSPAVEHDLKTKSNAGWHNSKIHVSYEEACEIGSYRGKKLYGHLPEEYSDDKQFVTALSKGMAKAAVGRNGVKLIDSKLFELKINDDARLYTTAIHENSSGDFLAIFDHEAGHKAIGRIARDSHGIEIQHDCDTFDLIGATSGELVEVY